MSWRDDLTMRRERLRESYARYRELGSLMSKKGLVSWEKKRGGYYAEFMLDRTYKERDTIKKLMDLQRNLTQQAMLLLELEHAIDCEEKKEAAHG